MRLRILPAAVIACAVITGAIAANPPDPARIAEARALIGALQMDKQIDAMSGAMSQGLAPQLAQISPRRDPRVMRIAMEEAMAQMREDATRPGGIIDQMTEFYANEFTLDELKQIRAFNESAVGQHMRRASPQFAQQMIQRSQAANRDMLGRICARVKARLETENIPDDMRCPAPAPAAAPSAPSYAPPQAPR